MANISASLHRTILRYSHIFHQSPPSRTHKHTQLWRTSLLNHLRTRHRTSRILSTQTQCKSQFNICSIINALDFSTAGARANPRRQSPGPAARLLNSLLPLPSRPYIINVFVCARWRGMWVWDDKEIPRPERSRACAARRARVICMQITARGSAGARPRARQTN